MLTEDKGIEIFVMSDESSKVFNTRDFTQRKIL